MFSNFISKTHLFLVGYESIIKIGSEGEHKTKNKLQNKTTNKEINMKENSEKFEEIKRIYEAGGEIR